jgi:GTP-binding protein Era
MVEMLDFTPMPTPPPNFRAGFVAIVGRPNVGKSTLMNQLIGQKVAITSPVAQTTRNRLRGILTTDTAQVIFVDTPGIHKPHHELGKVLVHNARTAISAVDVVLFVVDGSTPAGRGDQFIAELLMSAQTPVFLGMNKMDLCPEGEAEAIAESYATFAGRGNWPLCQFSAVTETGLPDLQQQLIAALEPGPYYYPPDLVTDQPERFIMGELIREQILHHTREEVPPLGRDRHRSRGRVQHHHPRIGHHPCGAGFPKGDFDWQARVHAEGDRQFRPPTNAKADHRQGVSGAVCESAAQVAAVSHPSGRIGLPARQRSVTLKPSEKNLMVAIFPVP